MIIGVVGSIASGKDTVADYLEKKGFFSVSQSDILRKIMKAEGMDISVPNMTEFGNKLRRTKGHSILAEKAFELIKEKDAVVTSIRQVGEIRYWREKPGFFLIRVDAPIKLRLKRLLERKRPGDIGSLLELKEIEAKQADGKNGGMNMNACYKMADYEVINDGTLEDLYKEVDNVIARIENKKN